MGNGGGGGNGWPSKEYHQPPKPAVIRNSIPNFLFPRNYFLHPYCWRHWVDRFFNRTWGFKRIYTLLLGAGLSSFLNDIELYANILRKQAVISGGGVSMRLHSLPLQAAIGIMGWVLNKREKILAPGVRALRVRVLSRGMCWRGYTPYGSAIEVWTEEQRNMLLTTRPASYHHASYSACRCLQ